MKEYIELIERNKTYVLRMLLSFVAIYLLARNPYHLIFNDVYFFFSFERGQHFAKPVNLDLKAAYFTMFAPLAFAFLNMFDNKSRLDKKLSFLSLLVHLASVYVAMTLLTLSDHCQNMKSCWSSLFQVGGVTTSSTLFAVFIVNGNAIFQGSDIENKPSEQEKITKKND